MKIGPNLRLLERGIYMTKRVLGARIGARAMRAFRDGHLNSPLVPWTCADNVETDWLTCLSGRSCQAQG